MTIVIGLFVYRGLTTIRYQLLLAAVSLLLSACVVQPAAQPPLTATPNAPRTVASATAAPRLPACHVTTGVKGGHLNLRAGPSKTFKVLVVVSEGDRLRILSNPPADLGWLNVQAGKVEGWVYSRFCEVKK